MKGRGESSSSPRKIEARQKAARALEMRKAGATYAQIAQAVGYEHPAGAKKAIDRAMKELILEPAEQLRQLELTRLDALFRVAYSKALKGEMTAVDRCLRIMELRAKLTGLEAPVKVEAKLTLVKGYVSVSPDDWPGHNIDGGVVVLPKPREEGAKDA